jgi:hypothetical protein
MKETRKDNMNIDKLKQLLNDNANDDLQKRLTERPRPPLGVYLQWQVREEEYKEFEKSGLAGITLKVVPLEKEGDPNSGKDNLSVLHSLFFARDEDKNADVKAFGGYSNWMDVLDGTMAEPRGLGPIPPRAFFNQGAPGGYIVLRDAAGKPTGRQSLTGDEVEAQGKLRNAYVRKLQGVLIAELIANEGKLKAPLFHKQAFYAVAGLDSKEGKYTNLVTQVSKGVYKNFSPVLPAGEKYGFAT